MVDTQQGTDNGNGEDIYVLLKNLKIQIKEKIAKG